jgi:hypothetical protein
MILKIVIIVAFFVAVVAALSLRRRKAIEIKDLSADRIEIIPVEQIEQQPSAEDIAAQALAKVESAMAGRLKRSAREMQSQIDVMSNNIKEMAQKVRAQKPRQPKSNKIDPDKQNKKHSSKRRSLQPAKTKPVPAGYVLIPSPEGEGDGVALSHMSMRPISLPKKDYSYKFYGSQLIVGRKTVFHGLGKHVHRLEITAQDQCFIDGKLSQIHPNDLEEIKAAILKAQEVK